MSVVRRRLQCTQKVDKSARNCADKGLEAQTRTNQPPTRLLCGIYGPEVAEKLQWHAPVMEPGRRSRTCSGDAQPFVSRYVGSRPSGISSRNSHQGKQHRAPAPCRAWAQRRGRTGESDMSMRLCNWTEPVLGARISTASPVAACRCRVARIAA